MKIRFTVVPAVVFFATAQLRGADPAELAQAIEELEKTLLALPALSYVSSSSYSMTPLYYEVNNALPADRPGHTVELDVVLKGQMYKFGRHDVSALGALYEDSETACNGIMIQRFRHNGGSLEIWPTGRVDLFNLYASPLEQFGFLGGMVRRDAIGLRDLQSPDLWRRLLVSAKVVGQRTVAGEDCLELEIADSYDPVGRTSCRYVVDLAVHRGYFPVHWASYVFWETLSHEGNLYREFTVTEFGRASFEKTNYFYPKTATGRFCTVGKNIHHDTMIDRDWKITSFDIKPITDDAVFTIDPAKTKGIVNQENHTVVAVPK